MLDEKDKQELMFLSQKITEINNIVYTIPEYSEKYFKINHLIKALQLIIEECNYKYTRLFAEIKQGKYNNIKINNNNLG